MIEHFQAKACSREVNMSFKIQDYECSDCQHVTEMFLDSQNPEQVLMCDKCKSVNVKPIVSVGQGKGPHLSWSSWRADLK